MDPRWTPAGWKPALEVSTELMELNRVSMRMPPPATSQAHHDLQVAIANEALRHRQDALAAATMARYGLGAPTHPPNYAPSPTLHASSLADSLLNEARAQVAMELRRQTGNATDRLSLESKPQAVPPPAAQNRRRNGVHDVIEIDDDSDDSAPMNTEAKKSAVSPSGRSAHSQSSRDRSPQSHQAHTLINGKKKRSANVTDSARTASNRKKTKKEPPTAASVENGVANGPSPSLSHIKAKRDKWRDTLIAELDKDSRDRQQVLYNTVRHIATGSTRSLTDAGMMATNEITLTLAQVYQMIQILACEQQERLRIVVNNMFDKYPQWDEDYFQMKSAAPENGTGLPGHPLEGSVPDLLRRLEKQKEDIDSLKAQLEEMKEERKEIIETVNEERTSLDQQISRGKAHHARSMRVYMKASVESLRRFRKSMEDDDEDAPAEESGSEAHEDAPAGESDSEAHEDAAAEESDSAAHEDAPAGESDSEAHEDAPAEESDSAAHDKRKGESPNDSSVSAGESADPTEMTDRVESNGTRNEDCTNEELDVEEARGSGTEDVDCSPVGTGEKVVRNPEASEIRENGSDRVEILTDGNSAEGHDRTEPLNDDDAKMCNGEQNTDQEKANESPARKPVAPTEGDKSSVGEQSSEDSDGRNQSGQVIDGEAKAANTEGVQESMSNNSHEEVAAGDTNKTSDTPDNDQDSSDGPTDKIPDTSGDSIDTGSKSAASSGELE